jgi:type II secretory pathway pseudopilin PulG
MRAAERLRARLARSAPRSRSDRACRPEAGERGESLIELLIALVIMGIAVVAIVGGIATSIIISDVHRKQATAGADVRSYAEAIQSEISASTSKYVDCGGPDDYKGYTPPDAADGYRYNVTAVQYWNGTAFVNGCSTDTDTGVQRLSLQVKSPDDRATETLDVVIRKPCRVSDAQCS